MINSKKSCEYSGAELCELYCKEDMLLCQELSEPKILFDAFEGLQNERQAYQEIVDLDPMTGLLSKRAFYILSNERMSQAKLDNQSYGLVICDVNNFKQLNDSMGHIKGDEVLMKVGEVFKENTRENDLLGARFGGDEFVFLCNLTPRSSDYLLTADERLLSATKRMEILVNEELKQHAPYLSAAFGYLLWDGLQSLNELIEGADSAMYQAKKRHKTSSQD